MTNKEWLNNLSNGELLEWLNKEYINKQIDELVITLKREQQMYLNITKEATTDVPLAKYDMATHILELMEKYGITKP